jgi:hypothetical protein
VKILTLDIETSPMDCYAWRAWDQNIHPAQIKEPTVMLSWAAKWSHVKRPVYRMVDDPDFHTKLHTMLNDADMTVGYNHVKFDNKHINREFLLNNLPPTRPIPAVDMLRVVKQRFDFPHNKLDYVAAAVLGERKLETGGFDLWPAFMAREAKALTTMKKYNMKDTVLTEQLYRHLKAWVPNHPNIGQFSMNFDDDPTDYQCEACGSASVTLERPRRTRCFAIRLVKCAECFHWQDGARKKLK